MGQLVIFVAICSWSLRLVESYTYALQLCYIRYRYRYKAMHTFFISIWRNMYRRDLMFPHVKLPAVIHSYASAALMLTLTMLV